MIVGSRFYTDLISQNGGKKVLMGLCISYLQERLGSDKNPLLKFYNPQEYRRLAYFNIDKYSIEITDSTFRFGEHTKPINFLL